MANNLFYITIPSPIASTLATYNQIKVYACATANGTFVEVTGPGTRLTLTALANLYKYLDGSAFGSVATTFYNYTFYNNGTMVESPFQLGNAQNAQVPWQQLLQNMQVIITVSPLVQDIYGRSFPEPKEVFFTTTYNPLYSAIRRIRLDIGVLLHHIPDDTINYAIFEASREADYLTYDKRHAATSALYQHARRQWTSYKAEWIILQMAIQGAGGLLSSKRLADMSVSYSTFALERMMDKLDQLMARWESELHTGGHAIQSPRGMIKGEQDMDRPAAGRLWDDNDQRPVGNAVINYAGSRRWLKTYVPKWRR